MITVTLNFQNIDDLRTYFAINAPAPQATAPVNPVTPEKPSASAPAGAPSNAAAPSAKAEPQEGKAADSPTAATAPKKPVGRPKKDATPPATDAKPALEEKDVRAALMKVNDAYGADGLAKTAEIVQGFGVMFIKELKPEQYADVIKKAEEVAKAKSAA